MELKNILFKKMIVIGGGDNISRSLLASKIKHSIHHNSIVVNSLDYMGGLKTFAYNLYGVDPISPKAKHFSHLIEKPLCEHFLTILKNFQESVPNNIIGLSSFHTFFSDPYNINQLKQSCVSFGSELVLIYINPNSNSSYYKTKHLSKIKNNLDIIFLDSPDTVSDFNISFHLNP